MVESRAFLIFPFRTLCSHLWYKKSEPAMRAHTFSFFSVSFEEAPC